MLHRTRTRRHSKLYLLAGSLLLTLLASSAVHAETIGLVDGQAYDFAQFRRVTLETSVLARSNGTRAGLRITPPRIASKFVLFVEGVVARGDRDDIAINGDAEYDGSSIGGGVYYTGLPDWNDMAVTLQLALQTEETEVESNLSVSGRQADVEMRMQTQSLSALFSPRIPLQDNGLNAYLELGLNNTRIEQKLLIDSTAEPISTRNDSRVRPFIQAGLVYPAKSFRFYAVVGYEESAILSLGARLWIGRTPSPL